MTLLLDSSVLIDVLRLRIDRSEYLAGLIRTRKKLATTAINLAEVYAGVRGSEASKLTELIQKLEVFAITPELGRRGGLLKNEWARRGRTIALDDALIAAVAIEYSLPLLTDNVRDFPMPELQLWPLPRVQ
ncbi:MAG TPA: PIN domain-containing protein [Terriglobales bacterium]|nr:PIN domain-containing protein [Terriglobales bacterium]